MFDFDSRKVARDKTASLYPPLPSHERVRVPKAITWPEVDTLTPPPAPPPPPVPISQKSQRLPSRPGLKIRGKLSQRIVEFMQNESPDRWWRIHAVRKEFAWIKSSNLSDRMGRLFELGIVERREIQRPPDRKHRHLYEYRILSERISS